MGLGPAVHAEATDRAAATFAAPAASGPVAPGGVPVDGPLRDDRIDREPGGTDVAELPMADRHETILPGEPAEVRAALTAALAAAPEERRRAVGAVVAAHPSSIAAWAELAALGRDPVERYAYARVGYHRGLDALRGAGWGGRGLVRWSEPANRPFLRCLGRLRDAAAAIGEDGEVVRITELLGELDPDWDDVNLAG